MYAIPISINILFSEKNYAQAYPVKEFSRPLNLDIDDEYIYFNDLDELIAQLNYPNIIRKENMFFDSELKQIFFQEYINPKTMEPCTDEDLLSFDEGKMNIYRCVIYIPREYKVNLVPSYDTRDLFRSSLNII